MSKFPDIALSLALAAAMLSPAFAQDAPVTEIVEGGAPAPEAPAPAAPSAATPSEAVQEPADVAPTPGASAASDAEMQQEAAGEIAVEATPVPEDPTAADAVPGNAGDEAAQAQEAASGGTSAWPGAGVVMKLGREALPEEVAAWNTDVRPDGLGLPEGSGNVENGEDLFSDHCAVCHGEFAEGVGNWPKLAGGEDTLDRDDPLKTVGSYWPYLSTSWDYVHRSMPFGNAQILTPDETYAITAYILYSNYLVDDDFVLSKDNFAEVKMPNADGFIVDDRDTVEVPEFSKPACMDDCKESVEITKHATVLDVTPETEN